MTKRKYCVSFDDEDDNAERGTTFNNKKNCIELSPRVPNPCIGTLMVPELLNNWKTDRVDANVEFSNCGKRKLEALLMTSCFINGMPIRETSMEVNSSFHLRKKRTLEFHHNGDLKLEHCTDTDEWEQLLRLRRPLENRSSSSSIADNVATNSPTVDVAESEFRWLCADWNYRHQSISTAPQDILLHWSSNLVNQQQQQQRNNVQIQL
jgi:hypothetical protein